MLYATTPMWYFLAQELTKLWSVFTIPNCKQDKSLQGQLQPELHLFFPQSFHI